MRLVLLPLLAGLATMTLTTPLHARCFEEGSRAAPKLGSTAQVPGPSGPFAYRGSMFKRDCRDGGPIFFYGAAAADGSELVPPEYASVVMLGPRHAIVSPYLNKKSFTRGAWQYFEVGRGITGPAPAFEEVGHLRADLGDIASEVGIPYGRIYTERGPTYAWLRSDYILFPNGDTTARYYPGLGGPGVDNYKPLRRYGDVLYGSFAGPDGQVLTRLLDLKGNPTSPVIGRVEVWRTSAYSGDTAKVGSKENTISEDLVTVVPLAPHPDMQGDLYLPILADGSPRPLPPGVLGMMPLRAYLYPDGKSRAFSVPGGTVTFGWAAVMDTPKGLRFVVGNGTIADVLELVGKQTPVAGVQHLVSEVNGRYIEFILLKSAEDGLWRALDILLQAPVVADPAKGYASAQLALGATWQAERERYAEDQARAQAAAKKAWELEYAGHEKIYQALVAKGDYCRNDPALIAGLHAPAITKWLRECRPDDFVMLNVGSVKGVDPALVKKGFDLREQARIKAEWDRREASRRSLESAEAEFQAQVRARAWANDTLGGANKVHDNFMKNSKDTYQRNLDAWNRGAQNWGGPRP